MSKVLIVEDDPREQRLYERLFTLAGFDVASVSDGQAAIEKATTWLPDIILLDVMMPKMNGLVTLDILTHKETLRHIPVVMLTNLSGEENKKFALEKGATEYVIKSNIDNDQLLILVRAILAAGKKT